MTNPSMLDPRPDMEMIGNVLDLGREELAPIAARYCSRETVPSPPVIAPVALLVGRPTGAMEPLASKLQTDGWEIWTCEGPEARTCPLAAGGECAPRDRADVTVMFMDAGAPRASMLPRIACAAKGEKPSVVALEGRIDPPRANGMHAVVGALRGNHVIAETVEDML